jgi:hypothetical protein
VEDPGASTPDASEEWLAPTPVSDEEFAVHEVVATDLVAAEEGVELSGIGRPVREQAMRAALLGWSRRAG